MSRPTSQELRTAVAPVREALLAGARRNAAALLAEAGAAAEATLAEARTRAADLRAAARAEGEKDAALIRARERARTRREARGAVLQAQAAAFDELSRRSRLAVRALRTDPGYPTLTEALRAGALAELGPGATVHEHPGGGVVAEIPGRRLDVSLDALADEALGRLGAEVQRLWLP